MASVPLPGADRALAVLPLSFSQDGLRIAIRVMPRAGVTRVDSVETDAQGRKFLRLRVKEAPDKGKANEAVVKLLSKEWKVPRSALEIVSGQADRNKIVALRGDPKVLAPAIGMWFAKQAGEE